MSVHDDDDDVGYGRPPKASRFTKGKSGNPSGRRKGSTSGLNSFEKTLARLVPVTINGLTKRITYKEALEMKVVEGCATLAPAPLLKVLRELEHEVERNRELERQLASDRITPFVRDCMDCKEIIEGLTAFGLVRTVDGFRQLVPEVLYKITSQEAVEKDPRKEVANLLEQYWPGRKPYRPDDDEDLQAA